MSAADLTTLAAAKQWLGVGNAADDALLGALVTRASAYVQQYINRTIAQASYTETRNGDGRNALMCTEYPVTAVTSVTVDGAAIPARATVAGSGYINDDLFIYLIGYAFCRGVQNVVVAYTAGFATTPADLEDATLELVGLMYRERDRIGLSSKAMGGETTAYLVSQLPVRTQRTIEQWSRVIQP